MELSDKIQEFSLDVDPATEWQVLLHAQSYKPVVPQIVALCDMCYIKYVPE